MKIKSKTINYIEFPDDIELERDYSIEKTPDGKIILEPYTKVEIKLRPDYITDEQYIEILEKIIDEMQEKDITFNEWAIEKIENNLKNYEKTNQHKNN